MNNIPGILSMGFHLPSKKVSVKNLADKAGLPEIVVEYIGAKYVYEAEKSDMPSDMGIKAAKNALEKAKISPSSIDLIINAPAGMQDYVLPPLSGKIQHGIEATNAVCYDISQGCCGMFTALHIAKNFIINNIYENILIVSSDKWSDYTDNHIADTVIFGDGAGAVIINKNSSEYLLKDFLFISKGEYFNLFGIENGGIKFFNKKNKNGFYRCLEPELAKGEFKKIYTPMFIDISKKILNKNRLKTSDIAFLNMVNANKKLLELVAFELNIPMEKTSEKYLADNGHIGGFDNLLNISLAVEDGVIKKGDKILNLTAGIGFTWGASIFEY